MQSVLRQFVLSGEDGSDWVESHLDVGSDDAAIDYAGVCEIDHPHQIDVWEGERLVARFTPRSPPDRRP